MEEMPCGKAQQHEGCWHSQHIVLAAAPGACWLHLPGRQAQMPTAQLFQAVINNCQGSKHTFLHFPSSRSPDLATWDAQPCMTQLLTGHVYMCCCRGSSSVPDSAKPRNVAGIHRSMTTQLCSTLVTLDQPKLPVFRYALSDSAVNQTVHTERQEASVGPMSLVSNRTVLHCPGSSTCQQDCPNWEHQN